MRGRRLSSEADSIAEQILRKTATPEVAALAAAQERFRRSRRSEMQTVSPLTRRCAPRGSLLDPATRANIGAALRHDFSRVRVHLTEKRRIRDNRLCAELSKASNRSVYTIEWRINKGTIADGQVQRRPTEATEYPLAARMVIW